MSEFPPIVWPKLEDWADIPNQEAPKPNGQAFTGSGSEWLDDFIARTGLTVLRVEPYQNGTKMPLAKCPLNPEHTNGSAALFVRGNGAIGFKCQHNSCVGKGWQDVRQKLEPVVTNGARPAQAASSVDTAVICRRTPRELREMEIAEPKLMIQELAPTPGAVLMVGLTKAGKTVLAMQMAIGIASGHPLFDYYGILEKGPVLFIEQDDSDAERSVKDYLLKSPVPDIDNIPFVLIPKLPFEFGDQLTMWLEEEIKSTGCRFVVLDSYTALRSTRSANGDIVKSEYYDLTALDELAKRTNCTILVLHHVSTGKVGNDWSEQAAGTFAMNAAVEAQIHVSRFRDFGINAPERLVRVRGRHMKGAELVIRFRPKTLDYEHVLDGAAASHYPILLSLQKAFGAQKFGPKDVVAELGFTTATATRHISVLYETGCLTRHGRGVYQVTI